MKMYVLFKNDVEILRNKNMLFVMNLRNRLQKKDIYNRYEIQVIKNA